MSGPRVCPDNVWPQAIFARHPRQADFAPPTRGEASIQYDLLFLSNQLFADTVVQGSAADLVKVAMVDIQNSLDGMNKGSDLDCQTHMILQIHGILPFLPATLPRRTSI